MSDWKELPRDEQVVLFVVSVLDSLREMGAVVGGGFKVSDNFKGVHREMGEEGAAPTEQEIQVALHWIQEASRSPN